MAQETQAEACATGSIFGRRRSERYFLFARNIIPQREPGLRCYSGL